MKCPFRKVSKTTIGHINGATGGYVKTSEQTNEEFEECYEERCMAYKVADFGKPRVCHMIVIGGNKLS